MSAQEMPLSLWEDFEARVTAVVRALPAPFATARVQEMFLDVESLRGQYGASVDETAQAIAGAHQPLSKDYRRWAA